MANRKQPTLAPPGAVKPPPPPAPPTRDQIAKDYALALTIIDRLRTSNAELLAALILCRSAINEEVIAAGDLDHPTIRAHAKAGAQADRAIKKAEGRS